ncbi:hypothetical protein JTB14_006576 [Gonioctena quinquepunctata]|nr:hypothetical protein JTB14_006576 [Gonioctena quinquepunctata]
MIASSTLVMSVWSHYQCGILEKRYYHKLILASPRDGENHDRPTPTYSREQCQNHGAEKDNKLSGKGNGEGLGAERCSDHSVKLRNQSKTSRSLHLSCDIEE